MKQPEVLKKQVESGEFDATFAWLYPRHSPELCRARYIEALTAFAEQFGNRPVALVSAPGRTEVSGNHTDHQRGIVLAASVDLDILCVAAPNADHVIRIQSKGYPLDEINLSDLSVQERETERAAALIRGIAAWFQDRGYPIGGFDAWTTSDVLGGSGLSSSAAFEVAVGAMLRTLYGADISNEEIAMAGQYAENYYFGKPSGLMDQMASAVGGFVQIDFADPEQPLIEPVAYNLSAHALNLCIVDTRGSHADLTGEYAAVPAEMGKVASLLGKPYLREVDPESFWSSLARVRAVAGDRAALRAIHFFNENALVPQVSDALRTGDTGAFLRLITQSGLSSFTCLQNVFSPLYVQQQGLSLALAVSGYLLSGCGACRVHGGGFAGTIQAFVPDSLLDRYQEGIDAVFGQGACHVLAVRPIGTAEITPDMEVRTNG